MDLIVRNGFVAEKRERMDVGIAGEKIVRVSPKIRESGRTEMDAESGHPQPRGLFYSRGDPIAAPAEGRGQEGKIIVNVLNK